MKDKKYYETNDFKKLQKDWYKKLKDTGFNDIETDVEREGNFVKQENKHREIDTVRINYFQNCQDFLHSGVLTDTIDLFIFEKHCEGYSSNKLSTLLKNELGHSIHRSSIDRRILNILKRAQIKPIDFNN
jgi:hypothetical protein